MRPELLTDIHTHILPGIDDGAKTIQDTANLLKAQYMAGVRQIVFTPHFYPDDMSYDRFIENRGKAFELATSRIRLKGSGMKFKFGAEVRYSTKLLDYDLKPLCIQNTPYLLLEFSTHHKPAFFEDALYEFESQGIIPVLAHVERFSYLLDEPDRLAGYIDAGALAQVNSTSLLPTNAKRKNILKLFQWKLVHVMASDAHSVERRPPNLCLGLDQISDEDQEMVMLNADKIFNGLPIEISVPHHPTKRLGTWV